MKLPEHLPKRSFFRTHWINSYIVHCVISINERARDTTDRGHIPHFCSVEANRTQPSGCQGQDGQSMGTDLSEDVGCILMTPLADGTTSGDTGELRSSHS